VRGSLSMIFVIGGLMSVAALIAVHDFGREEAIASAALLIPGAAGFLLSKRLVTVVDAGRTRAAVLGVSLLGAVAVLGKELFLR
jgi:hypothetical protein